MGLFKNLHSSLVSYLSVLSSLDYQVLQRRSLCNISFQMNPRVVQRKQVKHLPVKVKSNHILFLGFKGFDRIVTPCMFCNVSHVLAEPQTHVISEHFILFTFGWNKIHQVSYVHHFKGRQQIITANSQNSHFSSSSYEYRRFNPKCSVSTSIQKFQSKNNNNLYLMS